VTLHLRTFAGLLPPVFIAISALVVHAQESGGKVQITGGRSSQTVDAQAFDYVPPTQAAAVSSVQTSGSSTSPSTSTIPPPEPSLSYIDNICGILPDDRLRVRDPIFSNEISGCLLGFRPEQVTQAPQGRGSRAPQPPGPGRIIDRVIELVAAPDLDIAPSEIGLTGLETYVWIDEPAPVSVSASAGGTTVDARAFPSQYLWDWGDGNDTLTYDSGRPWSRNRPGSIEHIYETRGRYDLSVEVVWEAQWRINGGAWQALGFFSLGDSVDYPVRQVQARLTRTNN
jgi:hypothetical protein